MLCGRMRKCLRYAQYLPTNVDEHTREMVRYVVDEAGADAAMRDGATQEAISAIGSFGGAICVSAIETQVGVSIGASGSATGASSSVRWRQWPTAAR